MTRSITGLVDIRLVFRLAASGGLIGALIFFTDTGRLIEYMRGVSLPGFLLAACLIFSLAYLQAVRWRYVVHSMDGALSARDAWRIVVIALFFNQTLPSSIGGDAIRILEAKRIGMSLGHAASSVIADRMFALAALLILVVAGLPYVISLLPNSSAIFGLVALLVVMLMGFVLVFVLDSLPFIANRDGRVWSGLRDVSGASRKAFLAPAAALPALSLAMLMQLGIVLSAFILGVSSGLDIGFFELLALLPAVLIVQVAPVSVAGWGTREGAMILVLGLVGVHPSEALGISVLLGLALLLSGLPGGIWWLISGRRSKVEGLT